MPRHVLGPSCPHLASSVLAKWRYNSRVWVGWPSALTSSQDSFLVLCLIYNILSSQPLFLRSFYFLIIPIRDYQPFSSCLKVHVGGTQIGENCLPQNFQNLWVFQLPEQEKEIDKHYLFKGLYLCIFSPWDRMTRLHFLSGEIYNPEKANEVLG